MLETRIAGVMEKVWPNEGCGLVVAGDRWVRCHNNIKELADVPNDVRIQQAAFSISPAQYLEHSDRLKYIVHSHCVGAEWRNNGPSIADQRHQQATDIPWWVFVISEGVFKESYVFDCNFIELCDTYRPGVCDEFSIWESYYIGHGFPRFWRDATLHDNPMRWAHFMEHVQLGCGFKAVTQGEAKEGDLFITSDSQDSGPTGCALYYGDAYHSRDYLQGDITCQPKLTKMLYRQLRPID